MCVAVLHFYFNYIIHNIFSLFVLSIFLYSILFFTKLTGTLVQTEHRWEWIQYFLLWISSLHIKLKSTVSSSSNFLITHLLVMKNGLAWQLDERLLNLLCHLCRPLSSLRALIRVGCRSSSGTWRSVLCLRSRGCPTRLSSYSTLQTR